MDHFSSAPLLALICRGKLRHYPKGQLILYDGDKPADLFIVRRGIVKVYDIDKQGNEKVLDILKTPAMFPMLLLTGIVDEVPSFYAALTDAEIYLVPDGFVKEQMLKNNKLVMLMMKLLGHHTHEAFVRLSSLEKSTTPEKLIAALRYLSAHHCHRHCHGWRRVSFPVSHQLLADIIGVTRESATLGMKELQEQKIVRSPKLTVLEIHAGRLGKVE